MKRILCNRYLRITMLMALAMGGYTAFAQSTETITAAENAKPWVFWYWMQASVSREGITADLEAMKSAGLGGAYLMPIKGPASPPLFTPVTEQLTPAWWDMVRFATREADRLGLKLGMHVSDGFALAGGPWITPEKSMQQVVWTKSRITGGRSIDIQLQQPETIEGYYRDIAILAFPSPPGDGVSTRTVTPVITTSTGANAAFLAVGEEKEVFRSEAPCWIQYTFKEPFTCRSIIIRTPGNNYQAHRLTIEVSDDGNTFRPVHQLTPPRHGWQETDAVTHSIPQVTARYFRFQYNKKGSEPGAEDLDAAKWKPALKVKAIILSEAAHIHQYEGKSGAVWRVGTRTTSNDTPTSLCVPRTNIVDVTDKLDNTGRLRWNAPAGQWTILRMGHTSTGHTNATGGGGKGLECDKFDTAAVKLQYDRWFGEALQQVGPQYAPRVLNMFHVDSWECGSQNWSPVFREEFRKRRGYDLYTYLPAMAGVPVDSPEISERFLYDVRQTIAELIHDTFYGTLTNLAHKHGLTFSAESVAPTMTGDGMLHYDLPDIPMGEFWLRSPTHDKPNDMADAISGGHIYGKSIIQAEAFTSLRIQWDEHPGMLKALGDRNYALGINRLVYHVFMHNPWMDRKPGMTLDGIGLYFQRDQTWWKAGARAWVTYAQRCQALLQLGVPVTDIAAFTGEELPRRALLPDRLVNTLPGIFGSPTVARERERLLNTGEPLRSIPEGVNHSANMADPEDWLDPMRGYAFDSFHKDALLRLAQVRNGRIVLPGGASYALLVIPGAHPLSPDPTLMSAAVAKKILELVKAGATVLLTAQPTHAPGLQQGAIHDEDVQAISEQLWGGTFTATSDGTLIKTIGNGRVIKGPYTADSFSSIGLERDFIALDSTKQQAAGIAWIHRRADNKDIYFISNQRGATRTVNVSLRESGRLPELYDAVTGKQYNAPGWKFQNNRTLVPVTLPAYGSLFIILETPGGKQIAGEAHTQKENNVLTIAGPWSVGFNAQTGGPASPVTFTILTDWSTNTQESIRFYAGTAVYHTTFQWNTKSTRHTWLDLGDVANIAEVTVNGIPCGTAWTRPYRIDISAALKRGTNTIDIAVTNTWANRIIGDHALPEAQRTTRTNAPYRLEGKPLLKAGLLGPVVLYQQTER